MNNTLENAKVSSTLVHKVKALKKYTQPELKKLGAMQKVTLGGSIGFGDSGQGFRAQFPPNP